MRRRSNRFSRLWLSIAALVAAAWGARLTSAQAAVDKGRILDFLVGKVSLSPEELQAADVNHDGLIDVADVIALAVTPTPIPTPVFTPLATPPPTPVFVDDIEPGAAVLGSATADPSGSFVYQFPISLPPGVNGLAPTLSLNYNSRAGNGPLGVGWAFGGISAITRAPATLAQDGHIRGVDLTAKDFFALDGERLILISGVYGAPGAEYRTERNSFAKIVSYGTRGTGPAYFRVWTASGLIYDYGRTEHSFIEAPGSQTALAWVVSRVQDRVNDTPANTDDAYRGNYMDFEYLEESGSFYPSRISFTGNHAQSIAPPQHVDFEYEARPINDRSTAYIGGLNTPVSQNQRLKAIKTYASVWNPTTPVLVYSFTYETGPFTARSRLTKIDVSTGTGTLRQPSIEFAWRPVDPNGLDPFIPGTSVVNAGNKLTADFDNNGRTDFMTFLVDGVDVSLSTDAGLVRTRWFNSELFPETTRVGDFNGDGKADLVTAQYGLLLSTGTGFTQVAATVPSVSDFSSCFAIDYNGDGLTDLCLLDPQKNSNSIVVYVWNKDTSNFDIVSKTVPSTIPGAPDFWFSFTNPTAASQVIVGDFNGDGLTDLANYRPDYGLDVAFSTGTDFEYKRLAIPSSAPRSNFSLVAGRFNNDGLTDFLVLYASSQSAAMVLLNTGSSLVAGPSPVNLCPGGGRTTTGDFNGDGLTDIIQFAASPSDPNTFVSFATGDGHFVCKSFTPGIYVGTTDPVLIGDFDGNTLADVAINGATWLRQQGGPHDAITAISSPDLADALIEVDYGRLTDSAVYTRDTGTDAAAYPTQDISTMTTIVTGLNVSGRGIDQRQTISYKGGKLNLEGRGFLGFRSRDVREDARGRRTHTEYLRKFPFTGQITSQDQYNNEVLTSSVVNAWDSVPTDGGLCQFPYLKTETRTGYDLTSGAMLSQSVISRQYDGFGNAVRVDEIAYDGQGAFKAHTSTLNTYDASQNVLNKWLMGRLLNASNRSHLDASIAAEPPTDPSIVIRHSTSFEYDPDTGGLFKTIEAPSNPDKQLTKTVTRDGFGNVIGKDVSGAGFAATHEAWAYGARGINMVGYTNPKGPTEAFAHDPRFRGVLASHTDANGLVTSYVVDDLGRPLQELHPDGTWAISASGYVDVQPSGLTTARYWVEVQPVGLPPVRTYFDDAGRKLRVEDTAFDGRKRHSDASYDVFGLKRSETRPYAVGDAVYTATFDYDALDRPIHSVAADGSESRMIYNGLSVTTVDPNGHSATQNLDPRNNLAGTIDANSNPLGLVYDTMSRLVAIDDPQGNKRSFELDSWGRVDKETIPNRGAIQHTYDAQNRLLQSTDAKGNTFTSVYDSLGRTTSLVETIFGGGATTTSRTYDDPTHGKAIGKLTHEEKSNGIAVDYQYDGLSRLKAVTTTIDGEAYTTTFLYDPMGRVYRTIYPSTSQELFAVDQHYNAHGYPFELVNAATGALHWRAEEVNAAGQTVQERLGNGLVNHYGYDPTTGRLVGDKAGTDAVAGSIQDLTFGYDPVGNLIGRSDQKLSYSESFDYDPLNRLTGVLLARSGLPNQSTTFGYDPIGNLLSRSDLGTVYHYEDATKPHAVSRLDGPLLNGSLLYDANGNMTSGLGLVLEWTASNLPSRITKGGLSHEFFYGPDNARFKHLVHDAGGQTSILYVGNLYEKITPPSGPVEHVFYVFAGGRRIAIHKVKGDEDKETRWLHTDHLGSVTAITDETGQLVESTSYDAFGSRRDPQWLLPGQPLASTVTPRGFTDHEHLDDLGLIHMNGRVYHPLLGRFLSPDPVLQVLGNLQSHNAYSYVLNNPLSLTDPTGLSWLGDVFGSIGHFLGDAFHFIGANIKTIVALTVALTVAYFVGPALGAWLGIDWTIAGGVAGGFAGGFISSGGSLRGGLIGAVQGLVWAGVGDIFGGTPLLEHALAHATAGGFLGKAFGGGFREGFIAAGIAELFTPITNYPGSTVVEQTFLSAAVGGTAAELSGGSFANGALTAGYAHIFNDWLHDGLDKGADYVVAHSSSNKMAQGIGGVIGGIGGLAAGLVGWAGFEIAGGVEGLGALLADETSGAALLEGGAPEEVTATRAFWVGNTTGWPAAIADGANILTLSPEAQAAFDAGVFGPMEAESAAWAQGAVGSTADVYYGTGAGRTFWNYEFPKLMENINSGSLDSITIHF